MGRERKATNSKANDKDIPPTGSPIPYSFYALCCRNLDKRRVVTSFPQSSKEVIGDHWGKSEARRKWKKKSAPKRFLLLLGFAAPFSFLLHRYASNGLWFAIIGKGFTLFAKHKQRPFVAMKMSASPKGKIQTVYGAVASLYFPFLTASAGYVLISSSFGCHVE